MRLYSIDVKVYATAYIKADNEKAALEIARYLKNDTFECGNPLDSEVPVVGLDFDDPDLPEVSLSPVMTIHGPDEGDTPSLAFDDSLSDEEEELEE